MSKMQWAAAAMIAGSAMSAQAAVVYGNSPSGDAFTNPSTADQGQPIGASGWFYNNVRNNGTVGIQPTFPQSGNGSVYFNGTQGPAGNSSKADIEYLGANALSVGGNYYPVTNNLGLFTNLSSMSYDWYRSSVSTNNAAQHPSLRVLLDLDGNLATTGDRGGLVYEQVYNGVATAATDAWQSATIGASTKLWNFGLGLGNEFDIDSDGTPYDTLAEWQASGRLANARIIGFSSGIGSGWAPFTGAVDNISWTIAGVTTTTNFEVTPTADVPEPGSLALAGGALLALATLRRRNGHHRG